MKNNHWFRTILNLAGLYLLILITIQSCQLDTQEGTGIVRQKISNWVSIGYDGLVNKILLTHSGETVGQVIRNISKYSDELKGQVQPFLEPFSILCHDVLLSNIDPDTLPLTNILAYYPIGSEQPAWVDLFREGHYQLYFNTHLREQWLRDIVRQGQKKHILADEDAEKILSQVGERYIQRYLVSLVVHIMTAPVTQIVSTLHAWIWNVNHPEVTKPERVAFTLVIYGIYQIIPVSPGSLCRGLYTTCLAIYDRNFKDYNIALFLSYFKYVGYLAFPIQMSYHYPAMSRFMAAHWATEVVHIVPVFGERGALLEHWVYCAFYNWPLTIRRRMKRIAEIRTSIEPKYSHIDWYILAATLVFGITDFIYLRNNGFLPSLKDIWLVSVLVPLICGGRITLGCGGAVLWRRIVAATVCSAAVGVLYSLVSTVLAYTNRFELTAGTVITGCLWRVFLFSVLSTIGAIAAELRVPDPDMIE